MKALQKLRGEQNWSCCMASKLLAASNELGMIANSLILLFNNNFFQLLFSDTISHIL